MAIEPADLREEHYHAFWRSHDMCAEIANATLNFLSSKGTSYDTFQQRMKRICYAYCGDPDLAKVPDVPRPTLTVVK
jgi:hypothetical protein